MRKLNLLLTTLALAGGSAFTASAGVMEPAITTGEGYSVFDGSYVTSANYMVLSWGGQTVKFTNNPAPYFMMSKDGEEAERMTSLNLGGTYEYTPLEEAPTLTLSLGYLYSSSAGAYTIEIPAGIVENLQGDTNPAQTLTFTLVSQSLSSYADNFIVTPPQSIADYDYSTGVSTPAPFYKSSELSSVSMEWKGVSLQATGIGTVKGYIDYYDQKDFTDKLSFKDGKMYLDLSSLDDGNWTFNISEGIASGTVNEDGTEKLAINSSFSLSYNIISSFKPIDSYTVSNPREGSYYVTYLDMIQMSFGQPVKLVENASPVVVSHAGKQEEMTPMLSSNYYGEYILSLSFPENQTKEEAGLYTITIPANFVTNGEYYNEQITLEYFIVEPTDDFTASPEDKAVLKPAEFGTIRITYPDVTSIVANDKKFEPINVRGGSYGNYIYEYNLSMTNGVSIEGNTIIITLPEVYQVDYWVTVPSMDFIMDNTYANNYVNLQYSVWDGLNAAIVLRSPRENGYAVPSTSQILVTWDYKNVTATENFGVKITNDYGDALAGIEHAAQLVEIDNPQGGKSIAMLIDAENAFQAYVEDQYKYNHSFTVTIPAGAVADENGAFNPAQEFKFSVYQQSPRTYNLLASSEEGIYYAYIEGTSWMGGLGYKYTLTLTDLNGNQTEIKQSDSYNNPGAGEYIQYDYLELPEDAGTTKGFIINLTDFEDGYYTLTIPEGICTFNLSDYGYFPDFTNLETKLNLTIGEPTEPVITIGEVTYTPYPDGSVSFIVPVDGHGIVENEDITVYYKGPNDTDYQTAVYNHDQFSFDLTGLNLNTEYTVSIYAAAGEERSLEETVTFKTYAPVLNPAAHLINVVAEDITETEATLNVAYGFVDVPEGAMTYIVVTNEATKAETKTSVDAATYGASVDIALTGLTPATEYNYSVVALIEDAEGEEIASSEAETVTFTTEKSAEESSIEIITAEAANIGTTMADINVTFKAANLPEGCKVFAIATDEATRTPVKVEATEEGKAVIALAELTEETEYNYMVVMQVEDAEGNILLRSNIKYIQFTTLKDSGIDGINAEEDALYFTLDGIQIENPVPGTICVKVVGNKVTKVIVK